MKTPQDILDEATGLKSMLKDEKARYGSLAKTDPETWEHWFHAEDTLGDMRRYKAAGTTEETAAFRALYEQLKVMIDECLLPSDACEGGSVLMNDIPAFLAAMSRKNTDIAADIMNDMQTNYAQQSNEEAQDLAKEVIKRVKRAVSKPETKTAQVFNATADGNDLSGKTIVFTGRLTTMTRNEATSAAFNRGAKVVENVSKKTSLVVIGEEAGSKEQKAKALGIPTATEEQWRVMIGLSAKRG